MKSSKSLGEPLAIQYPELDIVSLSRRCEELVLQFDKIFYQICTVKKHNNFTRCIDLEFTPERLTNIQRQEICKLSGSIKVMNEILEEYRINDFHKNNPIANRNIPMPKHNPLDHFKPETEILLNSKISLLQDYLVRELTRSEALEQKLKQFEDREEPNFLIDRTTNSRLKLPNQISSTQSSSSTTSSSDDNLPQNNNLFFHYLTSVFDRFSGYPEKFK
jgi:hypothetical protein